MRRGGVQMKSRARHAVAVMMAIIGLVGGHPAGAGVPEGRETIPKIVATTLPAVVSITTRQIEHDQFNHPRPVRGMGSGFIVESRGYVLTNNHVVDGAEQIKVSLPDERTFRATLVGADPYTDLAVLKIEANRLPTLRLGDSRRLAVGETVIAIGSPLWIEGGPTVTVGVVSALGRSMEQDGLPILHELIQTDAAINSGNSGGPLLDTAGRVVGINTVLIPSAHGISFAISVDTAKPVLKQLIATGHVEHRSLGIYAVSVTPQVAYANDLPMEHGALVIRVDGGGPAEAAGFRPGDVVTAMAGERVTDLHHFHQFLDRQRAGESFAVTVWRDGKTLVLTPTPVEER